MQTQRTDFCTWGAGREGECGTHWESSIGMCTPPHGKQTASGKLPCSAGNSAPCSVKTWGGGWESAMGGRLQREGMYVYLQLTHVVVWQKLTQHYKAFLLQ